MDQQKQSDNISHYSKNLLEHPAHLWIGKDSELVIDAQKALQSIFCKQNACTQCSICKQIVSNQNSNIVWVRPEKNYTIDQLEPIFKTIAFALEPNNQFFFILQNADFFNQTCANALLKILEEPPTGYHFILLAQRIDYILPTIRSRCLVQKFHSPTQDNEINQLATWFKTFAIPEPALFSQKVDQANLSERESIELLDDLLAFWTKQYTATNDSAKKVKISAMIELLHKTLEKPPMPGSSKIFWKNFYLQVKNLF